MAAACCFTAPFSLSRHPQPRNRIFFVPSNTASQSQLSRGSAFSFRTENILGGRKSFYPLRVSCVGDTKAGVVTGKSWDKLIVKSETPVLVEFYASWCGPCRMVHRVIDEIANDYSGKLNCFTLDADKESQVAENYDIKAVPVVLLFKNGKKRDFIIGTMPKEFYVAAIEKVLAS